MLTELREKSQSFLIFILFGMLIVVFIFFFGPQAQGIRPGGPQTSPGGWAVNISGQEITQREVEMSVRRQAFFAQQGISDEELPKLRRETLEQVAGRALIAQRAAQMGLALGDEELSAYIMSDENPDYPLFLEKGKFSKKRYQAQISQALGGSLELYRSAKEREMIVKRYLRFLTSQVKVSDAEVRAAYDRSKRSWNLEYLPLDPADYAKEVADPGPEAGPAFAKANAKAVEDYYKAHKAEYDRDAEIKIRRVLVKLEAGADEAKKTAARAKVDAALARAKAEGADFAAVAKETSEGYYKAFGGDMGWQKKGNTSPADFKIYEGLSAGQISDVQESTIGFWFVKADEVRPAVKKPLDEVRDEIGSILARREARVAATRATGEALLARLKAGESLAEVAPPPAAPPTPEGVEGEAPAEGATSAPPPSLVKTTGPISAGRPVYDRIPGIGQSARLASLLPTLTKEKPLVGEIIEAGETLYLVALKERVEPDDESFAEDKLSFGTRLRLQRATALFGNWEQVLFGPARQRELFSRFGGGALVAQLSKLPASVKLNESAYPAPDPAKVPTLPIR